MVEASFAQDPASFWAHQVNLFYFDAVPSFADLARKAIANQKENWLAWLWYAEVLRRGKGPLDEQRFSLSKALELAPGNPIALTQLAWVEARSGNWKTALDASSKAVHSPPVGTDAMIALASALSHSGQCTDARTIEELIQERLKKNLPKDTAQIFAENHQACAQSSPDSARR
jgi:Flp pilus assembly protein TadD